MAPTGDAAFRWDQDLLAGAPGGDDNDSVKVESMSGSMVQMIPRCGRGLGLHQAVPVKSGTDVIKTDSGQKTPWQTIIMIAITITNPTSTIIA
jgi:hypothetical protein